MDHETAAARSPDSNNEKDEFASLTCLTVRTAQAVEDLLGSMGEHNRKFLRPKAGEMASTSALLIESSSSESESDDQSDEAPTIWRKKEPFSLVDRPALEEVPCYVLSFSQSAKPMQVDAGWIFGSGDFKNYPETGGVDLLLPKGTSSHSHVHSIHGHLQFDKEWGRLWILARHKGIKVDGKRLTRRTRRMLGHRAAVEVGPYTFTFEFKVSNEDYYQQAKTRFLNLTQGFHSLPSILSTAATPSAYSPVIGDWTVQRVVGLTKRSTISAASNMKSGEVVACKQILIQGGRPNRELAIYKSITEDVRYFANRKYVMRLHSVLDPLEDHPDATRNAFMLWNPLARGNWAEAVNDRLWQDFDEPTVIRVFAEVLCGLSVLHEAGWIHRDLKPANLGLVLKDGKWQAVILDLELATKIDPAGNCFGAKCGTAGYAAPEIINGDFGPTYGPKADVFSMGIIAYQLIFDPNFDLPLPAKCGVFETKFEPDSDGCDRNVDLFQEKLAHLSKCSEDSIGYLIFWMLKIDQDNRASLEDVLCHPYFKDAVAEI